MTKALSIFVFCFTILISCTKDDSENGVRITNIKVTDSGVLIEWNKAKTNDFNYYEVLRSENGEFYHTVNNIDSLNSPAYNADITSYNDLYARGRRPDWKIFYKVAVIGKNGNEVMLSEKATIETPPIFILPFRTQKAYLIPDKKQILFFVNAWSKSHISLYDYTSNKILQTKSLNVKSTGVSYGFGKFGNAYEFYFHDGDRDNLKIYDVHTMQQIDSVWFSSSGRELISDDKGHIYYANVMLDRSTLTRSSYNFFDRTPDEIVYNANMNCIFGTDNYSTVLWKMDLDDSGKITSHTKKQFDNDIKIKLFPGADYAIIEKGHYMSIPEYGVINLKDLAMRVFSKDTLDYKASYMKDEVLYIPDNYKYRISCYSAIDNFRFSKSIPIRTFFNQLFIDDDNNLIMIKYTDYNTTEIDKIKLVSD